MWFIKKWQRGLGALLLGDTHGAASATGSLGVLATHSQPKHMTQATMHLDLLHALQILTEGVVQGVGKKLRILAGFDVLLTIEEVLRDVELERVLHDVDDALKLGNRKLASTLRHVNLGTAKNKPSKASANTADGGQGILNLLLAINVGVQNTENVLKALSIGNNDRLI